MPNTEIILFGDDPTDGIIAVESIGTASVRVYKRADNAIATEDYPFQRWIITTDKHDLNKAAWSELEGEGFRYLAEFPSRESYNSARYYLRDSHAMPRKTSE